MRKGELGRRLEFYTHRKYGGEIPIYLNGHGTFSGVISDVVLSADTKQALIKLLEETLKNQTNLEWIPVIEIEFGYSWNTSRNRDEERNTVKEEVQIEFCRFWIAQKIDKHWIEASWDVEHWDDREKVIETGDRLSRSKQFHRISGRYNPTTSKHEDLTDLKLPHTVKAEDRDEEPKYYIPYTEELWTALNSISTRMEELQNRIIQVLKTPESRAGLIANISKLLPAPQPEPKKGKTSGKS